MITLGTLLPLDDSDYSDPNIRTRAALVCREMEECKRQLDEFLEARH